MTPILAQRSRADRAFEKMYRRHVGDVYRYSLAVLRNAAEATVLDHDGPTAEDLSRALSHLAFNQRSALVMRELEGRSYVEIAAALDISVKAVETLLFRARRALREQLEGSLTCH